MFTYISIFLPIVNIEKKNDIENHFKNYVQHLRPKGVSRTSHCVKNARIPKYSGPYFPAFGLNTERYSVYTLRKYGPE